MLTLPILTVGSTTRHAYQFTSQPIDRAWAMPLRPIGDSPSGERLATLEAWCRSKDIKDDERHDDNRDKLEKILEQTTRTNGRVDKLEAWQNRIKGGWWLAGVLGLVIGFIAEKLLK